MADTTHRCARCGSSATAQCGNCKKPYYCGKHCQMLEWREHHKYACGGYTVWAVVNHQDLRYGQPETVVYASRSKEKAEEHYNKKPAYNTVVEFKMAKDHGGHRPSETLIYFCESTVRVPPVFFWSYQQASESLKTDGGVGCIALD